VSVTTRDPVTTSGEPDLCALPKAHLHLHLTGGMRHSTLLDLARVAGVHLPERLVDEVSDDWRLVGWPKFQRLYDLARGVLRSPADIHRVRREAR
jgi:adenosine deaminase